jgi:hypothetical protein
MSSTPFWRAALRRRRFAIRIFLSQSHGERGGVSEFQIFRVSAFSAMSFPSARCLLTALRSGCPPWVTHLSFPLDMRYRAGVRSRSCRPSGCLAAGLVRIPPGMSHPQGYSCSLPRKPPLAWFPARPAGMCSRETSPTLLFILPSCVKNPLCPHRGLFRGVPHIIQRNN